MRTTSIVLPAWIFLAAIAAAQNGGIDWPSRVVGPAWPPADQPMGAGGLCVNQGQRIVQGEDACIELGGERYPARCSRVLNVTSWKRQGGACAALPPADIAR